MIKKSPTFCVLPFMSMAISPSGNLRICCNSRKGKNLILKRDGSPYKIYKDDLKSAWKAPLYRKIRTQMLNGEKPEICSPCFQEESAGIESARIGYNRKYYNEYYQHDTPKYDNIKYLDLRLGNKCNLRCRMCSPYTSSSFLKEWSQLTQKSESSTIKALTEHEKKKFKNLSWPDEMDFNKLLKDLKNIEEIYLTGGEPLLIKNQYVLLETIIQKGFAEKIKLKYNTNLTRYDSKIFELWKLFKQVFLSVSIDGFGNLNNYIRYPAKWDQLEKNINQMVAYKNQNKNLKMEIDCTVQMYNITQMKPFLLWVKKQNIYLHFNILDSPIFLNVRVLPDELKQKAEEDLSLFQKDFNVARIINYMKQESWNYHLKDFFEYTDLLDQSRNQTLEKILPEFSKFRTN